MLHAGQPGRGQRHRHRHLLANHGRFQRTLAHVDQNALAELDLAEVLFVGPVGAFGPGAGIGVVEEHLWHLAARQVLEVGDGQNVPHNGPRLISA